MLNEAKDSSEIENIITTHDELFEAILDKKYQKGPAKEVLNYKEALWHGMSLTKEREILTTNIIVEIQGIIEGNNAGIRKQSGTLLKNERTGRIINVLYLVLKGIAEMSEESLNILQETNSLINETTLLIKVESPKIYLWELVEVIFK